MFKKIFIDCAPSGTPFFDYKEGRYFLGYICGSLNQMMIIFGAPKDLTSQQDETFDEVDLIRIQEGMGLLDYDQDAEACFQAKRIDYNWDVLLEGRVLGYIKGACADYEYCEDKKINWSVFSQYQPQRLITGEYWHELANLVTRMIGHNKNIEYDFSQLLLK